MSKSCVRTENQSVKINSSMINSEYGYRNENIT